ncbi:MAG: ATP-binding cassette domain-containing protein, partial [Alphaproteobacteria bacterium]|nr:ATP-binding cassette domain-containing protein [Alphaproteobacteria bacterium]
KYQELLKTFNLDENKLIKSLSAGMKVKYQIALAMCHDAKLLILDEPTSGLDPVSRDELVCLFQDYVADGEHSILFSTHITSDLEKCADYVTYIKNGKILESTDIVTFKEKYLQVSGKEQDLTDELKSKIIGLRVHNFGYEGIILSQDKNLFANAEISKPTLEEIMVHQER